MSTGVVEQLEALLDAVAALDPTALTDDELQSLVVGLTRGGQRLAAVTAPLLARWDAAGVWSGDGSRTASSHLARECGTSTRTAHVELRRARCLGRMPHTAEAAAAGRISMDVVDLLGRADQPARRDLFVDHEQTLVDECARLRHSQAARLVEYWVQRADAAGPGPDSGAEALAASVHASTTLDGTVRIDGTLDPIGGAAFTAELGRLEREQYLADQAGGVVRTAGQRRAAALIEMATRSAATPAGARRPKPLFTVLVGDDTFSQICELATGTIVAPSQLVPHLTAAELETILFADTATVISTSPRRTFTGALRRAIEVRDRHCQHPSGCDIPAPRCDVDHIIPAADGGPTAQWNGRLECPTHNRHHDKHDHAAQPLPERNIDYLEHVRAQLRWRLLHQPPEPDDADDQ